MMRSFSSKLSVFVLPLALALSGCQNMPNMQNFDFQKLINISAGAAAAVGCYQLIGGGNMRYVTGAACGAGAYLLADSIQNGMKNQGGQYEVNRVADEYQLALNNSPYGNTQYRINSRTPEGDVLIDLRIFPSHYIQGTQTQCRGFFEQISVNRQVRSNKSRTACREIPNKWAMVDQ